MSESPVGLVKGRLMGRMVEVLTQLLWCVLSMRVPLKPPGATGAAGLGSKLGGVRPARPLKPLNGDLDLLNDSFSAKQGTCSLSCLRCSYIKS